MSELRAFFDRHAIKLEQVLRVSRAIETHTPEDRALRVAREHKRRQNKEQSYADAQIGKPRSGRAIGERALTEALAGAALTPRVRGKLLRAVNLILGKKGEAPATISSLFGATRSTRQHAKSE